MWHICLCLSKDSLFVVSNWSVEVWNVEVIEVTLYFQSVMCVLIKMDFVPSFKPLFGTVESLTDQPGTADWMSIEDQKVQIMEHLFSANRARINKGWNKKRSVEPNWRNYYPSSYKYNKCFHVAEWVVNPP